MNGEYALLRTPRIPIALFTNWIMAGMELQILRESKQQRMVTTVGR